MNPVGSSNPMQEKHSTHSGAKTNQNEWVETQDQPGPPSLTLLGGISQPSILVDLCP